MSPSTALHPQARHGGTLLRSARACHPSATSDRLATFDPATKRIDLGLALVALEFVAGPGGVFSRANLRLVVVQSVLRSELGRLWCHQSVPLGSKR